jgi:hypothetical protein
LTGIVNPPPAPSEIFDEEDDVFLFLEAFEALMGFSSVEGRE